MKPHVWLQVSPLLRIYVDAHNYTVQTRSSPKRKTWIDKAFCSTPQGALRWIASNVVTDVSTQDLKEVAAMVESLQAGVFAQIQKALDEKARS